jgi:voltage-gated potassium channel
MKTKPAEPNRPLHRQRWRLLRRINGWLEVPLIVLAVCWLLLLIIDLTRGLSAGLTRTSHIIWGIFIADFLLRFTVAPRKLVFLKHNIITALALVLPAIRILRVVRLLRALRGIRLVRVLASINRSMGALSRSMQRRGLSYVIALTVVVLFAGAAGMYAFENNPGHAGLSSYGEALWWTAMLLTTIGSEYWPRTSEGRALTLLLSLYGLGILGYVAGTLATFFIGREAQEPSGDIAGEAAVRELRREIALLRNAIESNAPRS